MDLKEKKQLLLEMKKKYLALKRNIPIDVRASIKAEDIIQGERSLQSQLPPNLHRNTTDYDIYSNTPKESAIRTKEFLNREFGGDYFKVRAGHHRGTYRVKSIIDEETYADFSRMPKRIPHRVIGETRYSELEFEKKKALRTLKKEKYLYRHKKDKNKIKRIEAYLKNKWY